MFGEPIALPEGVNCLPFLWTYLLIAPGKQDVSTIAINAQQKQLHLRTSASGARIFWTPNTTTFSIEAMHV